MSEYVDHWNDNTYENGFAQALADDGTGQRPNFEEKSLPFRDGYEDAEKRLKAFNEGRAIELDEGA